MKIAIDAFRTVCEPQTSGAVYVAELASALSCLKEVEAVYLVIPDRPAPASGMPAFPNAKVHWVTANTRLDPSRGYHRQLWWMQRSFQSTVKARVGEVDWLIAPYHLTPLLVPKRTRVLTVVHDLCGLRADCGYRKVGRGYWRHYVNFLTATLRADAIITISEYTKLELWRIFPSTRSLPTRVAFNSVTSQRLSHAEASAILAPLQLPPAYFLGYAASGPRKGTNITLQSYAAYLREGGQADLVLIGGHTARKEWEPYAECLKLGSVRWFSGITNEVRDALYANALALVFPSRCEGFGYPIVEAMRQGCPVAADKNSPAAEIVGAAQPLMESLGVAALNAEMSTFEQLSQHERALLAERLSTASERFSGHGLATAFLTLLQGERRGMREKS